MRPTFVDPFAKVRSLGGTLVVLLGIRAAMRVLNYVTFRVAVPAGPITAEQGDTLRMLDLGLLGLENLVTLVAMITFLVWIYRVFVAIRNTGGSTSWSPGTAVGGWFIPLANAILPWLTVRDALKSLGKPTALAGAWWLTWLLVIPMAMLNTLAREIMLVPELAMGLHDLPIGEIFELTASLYWPYVLLDTATWVLLLVIVSTVNKARRPTYG